MDRRRLLRVTHMVSTSEMLRRCRNSVPVIPVNGMRRLPASSQIILESVCDGPEESGSVRWRDGRHQNDIIRRQK